MPHFDPKYFKKIGKTNRQIKRDILDKVKAWKLGKDYYDGNRKNGYGGFTYDGRWKKLLPRIIKRYNLSNKSKILDLGCKKGFIMKDFKKILPKCEIWGIEDHKYPIMKAEKEIKSKIILKKYYNIPFKDKYFDFLIGFSSIYKYNLEDVIKIILEINRVSKKSFFSVASYSSKKEKEIFENWTLIGSTILSKKDWKRLFKTLKYKGDYYFTTSKSMRIK